MENKLKEKVMIKNLVNDKRGIEDSFKMLIFTFVIVSLFAMIVFTVIISQGNEYGKDPNEVIGTMQVSGLNNTVNGFNDQAETWRGTFSSNSSLFSEAIGTVTAGASSVVFVATAMFTMIINPFTYLSDIMVNVLQVPSWIMAVILALVIMAGIFGLWRLIKWGS